VTAAANAPSLATPRFLALMSAEVISSLGTQMTWLALPWFVLVITGSVTRMGIVLAAEVVPMAVLGIPSGMVVQRLGARRTMLIADLARVPLLAAVPALHAAGDLSFPALVALVAVTGMFVPPYFSSQRVILPEVACEDETLVARANSVLEAATALTRFAGPALAGVLIAVIGAANVLWIDSATYLVSFTLVATMVATRRVAQPAANERGVLAGVRFLLSDGLIASISFAVVLFGLFFPMLYASIPALAFLRYDRSPQIAGWLYATMGAGGLLGALLTFQLVARVRPLLLASVGLVLGVLPLWLLEAPHPAWMVAAILAVSGVFTGLVNAPALGFLTMRAPEALRGTMMTALITANIAATPIAYGITGPIIRDLGLNGLYAIAAAGETLGVAVFCAATVRHLLTERAAAATT
jgi:MFS family permease